ncbi:hypothetical protein N9997_01505 [Synechococcus sp. AH-603-L18]|nr:hypothetical protein [Synechococcus sp. AH-603-L18]
MFGAFGLVTPPPADAGTSCTTDSWGNTNCYGDNGSSYSSSTNSFGQTWYNGTDSNGDSYSGSCSTIFNTTTCY